MTKLRNKIYVLYRSVSYGNVIRIIEDRNPYRLHKKKIEIEQINDPWDIISSEKENCLYVSAFKGSCIWKIRHAREANEEHTIIKWLSTDNYRPTNLSMANDGRLLVVGYASSIVRIYGSNAELIQTIHLPRDIEKTIHAVETPSGNCIILYCWLEKRETENTTRIGLSDKKTVMNWGIYKLTGARQIISRRFIPSDETQKLDNPRYISLDSDDRLFVADRHRVLLLDIDLKWNKRFSPPKDEGRNIERPERMFYDEANTQLIVGRYLEGANVYALSRK